MMNIKQIVLALFTALGAYGGFPNPPTWWKKLTKFLIVRIFCLWALIYQGGGNADIKLTTIITIIIFGFFNLPQILTHVGSAAIKTASTVGSAAVSTASTVGSAAVSTASTVGSAASTVGSAASTVGSVALATEDDDE
jgi:hypothetical protein